MNSLVRSTAAQRHILWFIVNIISGTFRTSSVFFSVMFST